MNAVNRRYIVLFLFVALFCLLPGQVSGQNTASLEAQRRAILEDIEVTSHLLSEIRSSVQSSQSRLTLLTGQIQARKKVISLLNQEITAIDKDIAAINKELTELEQDLKAKREVYARSVQSMYTRHSSQYKWLFVLSADNFTQIVRRMRYIREYADWQKRQAALIMQKQEEITLKQLELEQSRSEKVSLISAREEENKQVEKEEADLRAEVQQLNRRQRDVQAELDRQRRQADALNRQIEQLVSRRTSDGYVMTREEQQLSDDFAANRGRLPFPLSGRYRIVKPFGIYQHPQQRNVRMESNGIEIQTTAGTEARAVFNGEVTSIFFWQGQQGVILRHGNYLTMYFNLSEVYVSHGDKVTTTQRLGKISTDERDNSTVLHFEIRRETEKLNPELWLN